MTVAELIQALSALNPAARVVVDGYEGGLCDVAVAASLAIERNQHNSDLYGPYSSSENERGEPAVHLEAKTGY